MRSCLGTVSEVELLTSAPWWLLNVGFSNSFFEWTWGESTERTLYMDGLRGFSPTPRASLTTSVTVMLSDHTQCLQSTAVGRSGEHGGSEAIGLMHAKTA